MSRRLDRRDPKQPKEEGGGKEKGGRIGKNKKQNYFSCNSPKEVLL
jgi:hypothetical protein